MNLDSYLTPQTKVNATSVTELNFIKAKAIKDFGGKEKKKLFDLDVSKDFLEKTQNAL